MWVAVSAASAASISAPGWPGIVAEGCRAASALPNHLGPLACSPVSPTSRGDHRVGRTLEHRPEAVRMGSHRGTDHHQSPTRTSKSDADVRPSTGLKLRRIARPPGSHLGGPGLRRRNGELVALDDVREPFGLRHWDFIAVRELDDLRHFCFAALSQADYRPKELFESGR
jgi:hypothetical protein